MGLLLDRLNPGWHKALAEGTETMQSLLMNAVCNKDTLLGHQSATGKAGLHPLPQVEAVLKTCKYDDILTAEKVHEAERQREIASLLHTLRTGPGISVQIEVPPKPMFIFDPSSVLGVDHATKLHTRKFGIRTESGIHVDIERLCLEEQEKKVGQAQTADISPDHSTRSTQAHVITIRIPEPPEVIGAGDAFRLSGRGLSIKAPSAPLSPRARMGIISGSTKSGEAICQT